MNRSSLATAVFGPVVLLASLSLGGCSPSEESPPVRIIAEGGAWTWFTDERAIVVDSVLYVGHVDTAGYVGVTVHELGEVGAERVDTTVQISMHREVDDHDNPALLHLDDGRTLAAYSQHHKEPHWYFRETTAEDRASWSREQTTEDVGANVTYSNLVQLSEEQGRVYNFFRGANFDPTMMTSDDGGKTWSEPRHVLGSSDASTRPYVKYASNGVDRIDLLYTQGHPRQETNNVYHLYFQNGTVFRSDGTPICGVDNDGCLPVRVDQGTLVYDASEVGRAWVWDLEYASDGSPVGVYVTARDSTVGKDLRYRYARYQADSSEWMDAEIAHAGTRLYEGENHYAGGVALDPSDVGRAYISTNVQPRSGDSTATGRYQIYRGTREEEGRWTWTQVTDNSAVDNLRPFVPRNAERSGIVLWLRGQYTSYTDYSTDVVGIVP